MRYLYRALLFIGTLFLLVAALTTLGAEGDAPVAKQTALALAGIGITIGALAAAVGERDTKGPSGKQ
ncbi:hypothetical protein [Microbispora sp. KK1-11]|uniref:hypothetical protein n=1 Tax=Microbispora sp. KK1-11 TaxID=2053005 RepID=UPI001158B5D9|nr:hypothetical protein [Microbispora sp. KK1-11]TQS25556.1 hypothetical protein FLW16_30095 [Microbispora sp. KK1-11]